jgi:DNA-binding CsgD family transcriptional regulator
MNKSERTLKNRCKYVKERIANCRNTNEEVKQIAKDLFLSERTIERDLKRDFKKKK